MARMLMLDGHECVWNILNGKRSQGVKFTSH